MSAVAETQNLQSVRGMNDLLPADAAQWEWLEGVLREWAYSYSYQPIRTPLLEFTSLFKRTIGEGTDIVDKEMFSFAMGEDRYTLRPEGTASCVRAVLQHSLTYSGPQRLWYMGPMFRHERPQKNRYRQFHQIGVEALGFADVDIELELILMGARLWKILNLAAPKLEINTLGTLAERQKHRQKLSIYFEQHKARLGDEYQRAVRNPLRLLDSKNSALADLLAGAPKLQDELGEASAARFSNLQESLTKLGVPFKVNPTLVRGLDYYNHTVFEWVCAQMAPQGTICAGGRYDGLPETLGGKMLPACGFALGIERLMQLYHSPQRSIAAQVYVAHAGEHSEITALSWAEKIRQLGYRVEVHCGAGGFKQQLKRAGASGAHVTLIFGEAELAAAEITVRDMLARQQVSLAETQVEAYIADFFMKKGNERGNSR